MQNLGQQHQNMVLEANRRFRTKKALHEFMTKIMVSRNRRDGVP